MSNSSMNNQIYGLPQPSFTMSASQKESQHLRYQQQQLLPKIPDYTVFCNSNSKFKQHPSNSSSFTVTPWSTDDQYHKYDNLTEFNFKENERLGAFNPYEYALTQRQSQHGIPLSTSSINKENGAHAVSRNFQNFTNSSFHPKAPTTAAELKELQTIRRLDTFLNLSLDKTWETALSVQQPVPIAKVPRAFPNYQYNPKSCMNRVKGCITWDGYLPPRLNETSFEYSKKVFLGGVPWDLSEQHLSLVFGRYGEFKVEWPNNFNAKRNTTKSFLYLIFEDLSSILNLLIDCSKEQHGGSVTYNYHLPQDKMSSKPIQVIPWITSDNIAMYCNQTRLDNKLTVFVGALHGRLYAQALGHIFEELFGNVAYVQIDTDRYKYPIGSGRVTFSSADSYRQAVEENFLTIVAPKFSKRIQIEPYIEDEPCDKCHVISAPNFCKSRMCFSYFCDNCWGWHHSIEGFKNHVPVKRNRKMERY